MKQMKNKIIYQEMGEEKKKTFYFNCKQKNEYNTLFYFK
jgi:hypothetical protein